MQDKKEEETKKKREASQRKRNEKKEAKAAEQAAKKEERAAKRRANAAANRAKKVAQAERKKTREEKKAMKDKEKAERQKREEESRREQARRKEEEAEEARREEDGARREKLEESRRENQEKARREKALHKPRLQSPDSNQLPVHESPLENFRLFQAYVSKDGQVPNEILTAEWDRLKSLNGGIVTKEFLISTYPDLELEQKQKKPRQKAELPQQLESPDIGMLLANLLQKPRGHESRLSGAAVDLEKQRLGVLQSFLLTQALMN